MLIVMLASGFALFLGTGAYMGYSINNLRKEARADIQAQAQILAANLSGALEFDDSAHALSVISTLQSKPQFVSAAVVDLSGKLLVARPGGFTVPMGVKAFPPRLEGDHISVCYPVAYQDRLKGYVYLVSDLSALRHRTLSFVWISCLGLILALLSAFWLGSVLQGIISRPIINLAQTARNVSAIKDYSLRAPPGGQDEIGGLIVDFNNMLAQIQTQDADLQSARNDLEKRVAQRTSELEQQIAKRLKMEAEMEQQKEFLDVTLRSIGEGIVAVDLEGKVIHMNAVAEYLTGWTAAQAAGHPLGEVMPLYSDKGGSFNPHWLKDLLDLSEKAQPAREYMLLSRKGDERFIAPFVGVVKENDGRVKGNVVGFRDVTEKRRTDQELLKASKLESISLLAGGLAHDFNNILTAILGNISLAKMAPCTDHEQAMALQDAESAAVRAGELTRQLLTFSKGGAPVKKNASLSELIQETVTFVLHGANVAATVQIAPGLWPAEVDSGQISQVIQNLIINAIQAMPQGGKLQVRATNFVNSGENGLPLAQGDYVLISVEDRGSGIAPENLSKIFDPYFTTKSSGHGLGLAMCYSIIRNHQGHIGVRSLLGYGSTFDVYLPATINAQVELSEPDEQIIQGSGRVLIMDDELYILKLISHVIERLGYEVFLAKDGQEALTIHRQQIEAGKPLDIIILDLTVPGGMSGREAIEKLRQVDKTVKTVVSSGYYNDSTLSQYRECGFDAVLPKPYDVQELSMVLSSLSK